MWPMYVDYSSDECKKVLRGLELDAYSSIINAFRAQGVLTRERRKMLLDLCSVLGISMERHRAEVRRAINDEHLNTIAERLYGPNTVTEWAIEGRRLVPLMPRLVPQTVFTALANSAANAQAVKNAALPLPGKTGSRELRPGVETMSSRKRKEPPDPPDAVPQKISSLDCQYHIMLKSASTVTTFSSFDQLASNLMASRPTAQSPIPTVSVEDHVSTASELVKTPCEMKTTQKTPPSISTKSPAVLPSPVSTPMSSPAVASSPSNKFLTQIRPKNTGHTRQSLPSTLGLKLNSQPQISQRTISPKSTNIKVKQDNAAGLFTKKTSTVFSTPAVTENQTSQFSSPSVSESLASKTSVSVSKSNSKLESQSVPNQQSNTKLTTVAKSFPKTSPHGSQYMARSFFSSTSKSGTKSLAPVIFNVSSTTCSPLQTSTKTTGPVQSESSKTNPQLLPKSTAVGISHSHLKLNTSNTQTIQYRNDGGMVRSARIVNISQPVGSRLPCAISPSTISALGLASNLSSTALRVTLPAGTLNNSSSMRVSAAAKPNVIVVHKAQMWPRTQGAVIMSSTTTLPRLPSDVLHEAVNMAQKQEKRPGAKIAPKTIAPARPLSPVVSATTIKIPESSLLSNPAISKASQQDGVTQPENSNAKVVENSAEAQCKRNLLADIIEASGILLESNSEKNSSKDNGDGTPIEKGGKNQEPKLKKAQSNSISSSTNEASSFPDSSSSKAPVSNESSESVSVFSIPEEKNGNDVKKQGAEKKVLKRDSSNTLVSTSQVVNEQANTEQGCQKLAESANDKNL
ncbi:BRCA2-interacting transcriptional repressor EMSY-like [Uloborus diversus]|uniref:BRCA2-interacting transcriptional repressor EMSY-like n=1 Tax=Uloborus diversus TaxID=327109 RepID=UPI00240A7554|nr:BRCA2-interacting transcriptional repressor EMSY-like [Uloborus diversus]